MYAARIHQSEIPRLHGKPLAVSRQHSAALKQRHDLQLIMQMGGEIDLLITDDLRLSVELLQIIHHAPP